MEEEEEEEEGRASHTSPITHSHRQNALRQSDKSPPRSGPFRAQFLYLQAVCSTQIFKIINDKQ